MPRFFFDFQEDGRETKDVEGHEISTLQSASDQALEALLEIVMDKSPSERRQAIYCHIRDEAKDIICKVSVILQVDHDPVMQRPIRLSV